MYIHFVRGETMICENGCLDGVQLLSNDKVSFREKDLKFILEACLKNYQL